ncbi:MAG: OmpA family protein [Bacteroidetes bacterium]|nr:OmpA family protein [Bacteroidota bacterium]
MKKLLLSTLLLFLAAGAMHASDSTMVRRAVYFDVDISQLNTTAQTQLDSMATALKDLGEFSISIYGSADVDGSAGYNQKLSERRAKTVQDYLMEKNIKAVKCVTRGLGRKGDELSKSENRKVDIEVSLTYFSNVQEIFQSLGANTEQQYQVDAGAGGEIKCRNNTTISIPAEAFVNSDGRKVSGKITVTVKEALNMADFLAQDLSSVSDGQLLESRGMVYIDASANGQRVSIDQSKPINVAIPALKTDKDMKLFYGVRHGDQRMNWKVADKGTFEQNVKTVPIDIDRSLLAKVYITDRVRPAIPTQPNNVKVPVKPTKPRAPLIVEEPVRGTFYTGTAMEKAFHKKKKIEAEDLKLYTQAYKKYQESLKKQVAYQANMRAYELAEKKYKEDVKAFEAEGIRRKTIARYYFRCLYEYSASGNINKLIKSVEIRPITNETRLMSYERNIEEIPSTQHEDLRAILGEVYFNYYHYNYMNAEIADANAFTSEDSKGVPTFYVSSYDQVYDSLYQARRIGDAMSKLQGKIMERCAELGLVDKKDVTGYIAAVSQLGWINCDRFVETPSTQLVQLRVKEQDDVKMYMVFSDINSCLPLGKTEEGYESSRVPRNKEVRIISIKVTDGKPQLAVAKINTSSPLPPKLEYKTCSLDEIRSNFAALPSGS